MAVLLQLNCFAEIFICYLSGLSCLRDSPYTSLVRLHYNLLALKFNISFLLL